MTGQRKIAEKVIVVLWFTFRFLGIAVGWLGLIYNGFRHNQHDGFMAIFIPIFALLGGKLLYPTYQMLNRKVTEFVYQVPVIGSSLRTVILYLATFFFLVVYLLVLGLSSLYLSEMITTMF